MATGEEAREAFRYVVRDSPFDEDLVRVGAWTPSRGYLPQTELSLPRTVLADVRADGPLVDVLGEQRQASVITFAETGSVDLNLVFYQLVQTAPAEAVELPQVGPLRDYCAWSWPVGG
jgi:hypothetical protein